MSDSKKYSLNHNLINIYLNNIAEDIIECHFFYLSKIFAISAIAFAGDIHQYTIKMVDFQGETHGYLIQSMLVLRWICHPNKIMGI